ncbi:MAG: GNAT family N-acetyltransferase [Nanoarchaeota archaeon]
MDNVKILNYEYDASNGQEIFISAEDIKNDILLGFVRLRIPYKPFRQEIISNSAGIRELHVYGAATALDKEGEVQHRGLGKQLMNEAEKIAREKFDIKKLLVISGIGVKEYYRTLGYKNDGVYVSKVLS